MTGRQLLDERVGQARERVVDRVADVAVVDVDAVRRRDQLDDLAGVERAIDRLERTDARGALLGDRIGDLAQRRADAMDACQLAGCRRPDPAAACARERSAPSRWITPRSTNQASAESSVGIRSTGKPFSRSSVFRKSKVLSSGTS